MRVFGTVKLAYLPVLITYFCYGASAITTIALLFFQKDGARHHAGRRGGHCVLGRAAVEHEDGGGRGVRHAIRSSAAAGRRISCSAPCDLAGYALLATVVSSRGGYLAAMVLVTIGFMVQDVVADALSVEVARTDEEIAQVQALGRMALLAGGISVGYLSGRLAGAIGPRGVFAAAMILPLLVAGAGILVRPAAPLGAHADRGRARAGKTHLVLAVGLGYAALGIALEALGCPSPRKSSSSSPAR